MLATDVLWECKRETIEKRETMELRRKVQIGEESEMRGQSLEQMGVEDGPHGPERRTYTREESETKVWGMRRRFAQMEETHTW